MEFVLLALLIGVGVLVVLNRRNADQQVERVVAEVQEMAAELPELLERIGSLEDRLGALDLGPIQQELRGMRRKLEELAAPAPEPEPVDPQPESLDRARDLRRRLERRLRKRGLIELEWLDDSSVFAEPDFEIGLEAMQDGRVVKGRVQVVDGEVRSIQLEDSLRQFP